MSRFLDAIISPAARVRNVAVEELAAGLGAADLWNVCLELDAFRRESGNLYHRVRALFFLYAICRFCLPPLLGRQGAGLIPANVHGHLLDRRFPEAIDELLSAAGREIPDDALCSGLAQAFYQLGLQNLADQVRRSVRSVRGNQWMFRCGHPSTHPLRIHSSLKARAPGMPFPILSEKTAVRMDLSHSAWSDIFFLGMDYPEGARVLNVSIDLALESGDEAPQPPVSGSFRVIDEPVIRLTSVDLGATSDITDLGEMFHFAKDYLGLLKAAVIASGMIPIGMEGSGTRLSELLTRVVGPGHGFELVSTVNNIPKGSRLAVSTNLLGSLIAVCMRATGQTASLTGPLQEEERRIVAARAILGEWLGGSGGGWQDSGGVWPGIKIISGCKAKEGDPEWGVSRGRLLPAHRILGHDEVGLETRRKLQDSLVLVHGGMAQNVGPILEMVTEKYLLRSKKEWLARAGSLRMFDEILAALKDGDIRGLGALTTKHFFGPLQTIIPWATTLFTEKVIAGAKEEFGVPEFLLRAGDDFLGEQS
ncbi:MAG: UTP--glucose-1-phosphate uridylyltransferase, partial [Verrucomicrobiae bacterium]